jgi:eukaryotic-like serine/threonine-protein kinase
MMTDSNIGCMLANRYQLVEMLGQGSMGRVYGAKDVLLGGVPVAIKAKEHSYRQSDRLWRK